ncbi:MAG TPA: hypothetical protein VHW23_08830 [Kofleriaceae bacterium]|jgi:hypothetical protein|nr:hypothetical protein [Kofleriaceae bacterium]
MRRSRRIPIFALLGSLALGAPAAVQAGPRPQPAAKKARPTPMTAEHKKALAELFGGFKFGMTKDEVIAVFAKQLDARYDDRIKDTTDTAAQDQLRRDKRNEVNRLQQSYVSFDAGKPSPWDVSIVEDEFAHNTGESMLERWENQGGKNQRRFFFFFEGKLWKMFISLDVSILPEDKLNFETFRSTMERIYGPGDVEGGKITWRTDGFDARAVDKLKSYGALAQVVEDPRVRRQVEAVRQAKAPPRHETNSMIKAVIDSDNKDHPSVKADSSTVDAVIRAQGGSAPPPK